MPFYMFTEKPFDKQRPEYITGAHTLYSSRPHDHLWLSLQFCGVQEEANDLHSTSWPIRQQLLSWGFVYNLKCHLFSQHKHIWSGEEIKTKVKKLEWKAVPWQTEDFKPHVSFSFSRLFASTEGCEPAAGSCWNSLWSWETCPFPHQLLSWEKLHVPVRALSLKWDPRDFYSLLFTVNSSNLTNTFVVCGQIKLLLLISYGSTDSTNEINH